MTSSEKSIPSAPKEGTNNTLFKRPSLPLKYAVPYPMTTPRNPLSKIQKPVPPNATKEFPYSPCVQLGQKRPNFPYSPSENAVGSSGSGKGTRFFCEDDWLAWKSGVEKFAVATSIGPIPRTPPPWVAMPHRSGLHHPPPTKVIKVGGLGTRRRLVPARAEGENKVAEKNSPSGGVMVKKLLDPSRYEKYGIQSYPPMWQKSRSEPEFYSDVKFE